MNEFEDIEQLLKPQCEFKASETLKQEVMEKARQEVMPRRTIKLWPWLAAACIIGFIIIVLMPPKLVIEQSTKDNPILTKVESMVVEEQQEGNTSEPIIVKAETPKRRKGQKTQPVVNEEPVQMSEETRIELLLAMSDQNNELPRMEEIDIEEEIRQMRQRGEQMINIYEQNDK